MANDTEEVSRVTREVGIEDERTQIMANETETNADKARKNVEDLLKTVITTSGIMLALLWGLTQRSGAASIISIIRYASIVLVISIFFSLLGLQFIVSQLEKDSVVGKITKRGTVAFSYFVAWISFIAGCILLIVAIFRLTI